MDLDIGRKHGVEGQVFGADKTLSCDSAFLLGRNDAIAHVLAGPLLMLTISPGNLQCCRPPLALTKNTAGASWQLRPAFASWNLQRLRPRTLCSSRKFARDPARPIDELWIDRPPTPERLMTLDMKQLEALLLHHTKKALRI